MLAALALALALAPSPVERLHAAAVVVAVGDHRDVATELVSSVLEELRGPDGAGGYRWAGWAPGGGPKVSEEGAVKSTDAASPSRVSLTAEHASSVTVRVPRRRSLFSGNYPCTVTSVTWRCPAWSRDETAVSEPRRLARGESFSIELERVCPELTVDVEAVVDEGHRGDSELEVEATSGHLEDDGDSPFYPAAARLAALLASPPSSADRWVDELVLAAEDLGGRRSERDLHTRLVRVRRLLEGSPREQRRALEELEELIRVLR